MNYLPPQSPQGQYPGVAQNSGKATAALVLGIIGIIAGIFVPIVGLILGVLAVIFGSQERSTGSSHAKNGFILGIIAIVVSLISWVIAIAILTG